jgi:hypothetical protein
MSGKCYEIKLWKELTAYCTNEKCYEINLWKEIANLLHEWKMLWNKLVKGNWQLIVWVKNVMK